MRRIRGPDGLKKANLTATMFVVAMLMVLCGAAVTAMATPNPPFIPDNEGNEAADQVADVVALTCVNQPNMLTWIGDGIYAGEKEIIIDISPQWAWSQRNSVLRLDTVAFIHNPSAYTMFFGRAAQSLPANIGSGRFSGAHPLEMLAYIHRPVDYSIFFGQQLAENVFSSGRFAGNAIHIAPLHIPQLNKVGLFKFRNIVIDTGPPVPTAYAIVIWLDPARDAAWVREEQSEELALDVVTANGFNSGRFSGAHPGVVLVSQMPGVANSGRFAGGATHFPTAIPPNGNFSPGTMSMMPNLRC